MLQIACGVMRTLVINEKNMRSALSVELLATDMAYYLVRKNVRSDFFCLYISYFIKKAEALCFHLSGSISSSP
jgi:hypothetical protein